MIECLPTIVQECIWLHYDPFGIEDFIFDIVKPMYSLLYIREWFCFYDIDFFLNK